MALQIIIIQVVTFICLIVVLRMIFYRQLNTALVRLKGLHEENIKKEEQLKKELDVIKKQRDVELSMAKEEAARLIKDAREKAERLGGDSQHQAQQHIRQMLEQSKQKLQAMENELNAQFERQVIQMSEKLFSLVFSGRSRQGLQRVLILELIDEIAALPAERFPRQVGVVQVRCGCPLSEDERSLLKGVLSEKTGGQVELSEQPEETMIAGLIMQLGPLTLDGSLKNRLDKAILYAKKNQ
jgi:F0F1-type ATP synthase membrane subunit b/b'